MKKITPYRILRIAILIGVTTIIALTLCCSCSHTKITTEMNTAVKQVAHDTLMATRMDSSAVRDTIILRERQSQTDSVIERNSVYIVVDSVGTPIKQFVYRDRQVYHNRDALSSNSHSAVASASKQSIAKNVIDCKSDSISVVSKTQTQQTRSSFKEYLGRAMLVLWIISMLYYFYLYKKRK